MTSLPDAEVERLFAGASPLIEATLTQHYRLPPEEALELKLRLRDWFHRFSRRAGSDRGTTALQTELLLMACRAAHVLATSRSEEPPHDDLLHRTLVLGPEVVAIEIQKGTREGNS